MSNTNPNIGRYVLGIDIGSSKVAAVYGTLNENGKLIVAGAAKAVNDGAIQGTIANVDKTAAAIDKAVSEATRGASKIDDINVSFSGHQLHTSIHRNGLTRTDHETEISVQDVDRLRQETYSSAQTPSGYKMMHAIPQKYIVDDRSNINDPVGMVGTKLIADYNVIDFSVNALLNIKKVLKRNQLDADNMVQSGLASALAVLSPEEMEVGVALIDIGSFNTEILIFQDKVLRHLTVLPLGGAIVTADIEDGCVIQKANAENIKISHGDAMPEKTNRYAYVSIPGIRNRAPKEISVTNLSRIVSARYEEIIEIIHNELLVSGWSERLGAGLVITGGGSQVKNLPDLFELMTGMETRLGPPTELLGKTKTEIVKQPAFATAVGLVLHSLTHLDERDIAYEAMREPLPPSTQSATDKIRQFLKGGSQDSKPKKTGSTLGGLFDSIIGDKDLPQSY